jgi:hypothetical protein
VLIATVASHAGQVTRDPDLHDQSTKIKEQARQLIDSVPDSQSIVPAACFQVQSAKYISFETVPLPSQFIVLVAYYFLLFRQLLNYCWFQVYRGGGQVDVSAGRMHLCGQ